MFFCKTGEDGKKLHEASCSSARHMLQKVWKNKNALMCSLCENQLKSIDILESKLENLKEEVGPILKEENERSKPESSKESLPK